MWHLKDEKEIYYLTKEYQIAYIERLADICKKAYSDKKNKDDILRESLGIPNENRIDKKEHKYDHTECKGCDTETRTEKRICRCMYYFNQNEYPKRCDNKSCKFYKKWKNVGDIEIVDYEVPTKYVIDQVGGIDLILKDKNGKLYGAEVKPEY